MPLLLALQLLEPRKFAATVASIERFVFRYKTIGNVHIGKMTKLYLSHAKKIRETKDYSTKDLRADLTSLVEKAVPDSVFKANLSEMKYLRRGGNGHIRYFLMALEDYTKWYSDGANGVPRCKDKTRVFDVWNTTLEHVYPSSAEEQEKDQMLEAVKDTIGNLTICGPGENNNLANKGFAEKRSIFANSGLQLNRNIAERNDWTATDVEKRADLLLEMALKVFVP